MKKLFIPTPLAEVVTIPPDLAHHVLHVLRHDVEEPVLVSGSDKKSGSYRIRVAEVDACEADLLAYIDDYVPAKEIVLVQSFLKGDKFEWVLQKATELNVAHIYGAATKHGVVNYDGKKLTQKEARWQKIVQEASQQCGRSFLPELTITKSWIDIVREEVQRPHTAVFIAYEREDGYHLKDGLQGLGDDIQRIVICIGPEGGFHPKEVDMVTEFGGTVVTLGRTILRAETAAIAGVSMIQYEYSE